VKRIFADAGYWIALLNPKDQLHPQARALESSLRTARLVTTEFVLAEFLNFYAPRGHLLRLAAAQLAGSILNDAQIEVMPPDRKLFADGVALYLGRPDKHYSLTDCISMVVMRRWGITEALTQDRHFRQEGLRALFKSGG